MPARFRTLAPVLLVDDVAPSLAFFRDRLGFSVENAVEEGGAMVFATVRRDDVALMLQTRGSLAADVGEELAKPMRAALEGSWTGLYIGVDDVDLLIPEVADADVVIPPRKTWYGMHEITVREPNGHVITFASRVRDEVSSSRS